MAVKDYIGIRAHLRSLNRVYGSKLAYSTAIYFIKLFDSNAHRLREIQKELEASNAKM